MAQAHTALAGLEKTKGERPVTHAAPPPFNFIATYDERTIRNWFNKYHELINAGGEDWQVDIWMTGLEKCREVLKGLGWNFAPIRLGYRDYCYKN